MRIKWVNIWKLLVARSGSQHYILSYIVILFNYPHFIDFKRNTHTQPKETNKFYFRVYLMSFRFTLEYSRRDPGIRLGWKLGLLQKELSSRLSLEMSGGIEEVLLALILLFIFSSLWAVQCWSDVWWRCYSYRCIFKASEV